MHSLCSQKHSPVAMAGESQGLGTLHASLITSPPYRATSVPQNNAVRTQYSAKVSKGFPTAGLGGSLPPIHRRFRASWLCCVRETHTSGLKKNFIPVFIYFRYSINAICTAQVRRCQHFPFRLLFSGDGNLIATFVLGSSRPRRGLSAKPSSTHLQTPASATHPSRDQFKMMEVNEKHSYVEFWETEGVVSTLT